MITPLSGKRGLPEGSPNGLTLLELLIAISIFAGLCVVLAGLVKVGFDLWKGGERQGDITDRQQIALEYLRADLSGIYAEKETREIIKNVTTDAPLADYLSTTEPSFYTDTDPSGNRWLYLVRADNNNFYYYLAGTNIPARQFTRVFYYLKNNALWRVTVDKATALAFFKNKSYQTGDFPAGGNAITFDNILYLGLTLQVDETKREIKWNSLPANAADLLPSAPENILVPKQTLPRAAELEVVFKPAVFPPSQITLTSDGDNVLNVSYTQGLPTPPEYVKIDQEWLSYSSLTYNTILIDKRGARNTQQTVHPPNSLVLFGTTVKDVMYLTTNGKDAK